MRFFVRETISALSMELGNKYPFHEVRLQDLPLTYDTDVAIRCYLTAASTATSVGGVGD